MTQKTSYLAFITLRNMNLMWSEMTDAAREEYKAFFLAYHDTVSEAEACSCAQYTCKFTVHKTGFVQVAASGFTGRRIKPLSVLPPTLLRGFETAVLAKVASVLIRDIFISWRS